MNKSDISLLVIDDEKANVDLLIRILRREGYERVRGTVDPEDAVPLALVDHPDIVLLDLHMPRRSGIEVMHALRECRDFRDPFVVILTGDVSSTAKTHALSSGARDFITKPFDVVEVVLRIANLADLRTVHKALYQSNATLEAKVLARTAELELARSDIIHRLGMAAEFRDDDTGQHTRRVGTAAATLARSLGWSDTDASLIERAAPLHDVGKIAIPDHILLKPGKLDDAEMAIMRTHTTAGARLLSASSSPLIEYAREIALTHHEKWDGTGYPHGLAGTGIPVAGRVVALVDFFDALTHDRPYRSRFAVDRVIAMIQSERGSHFDPDIVDVFMANGRITS